MEKRLISIDDLYYLEFVADPQISPQGDLALYSVKTIDQDKNNYISHIHLVDLTTGISQQFTFGKTRDTQPRWSPNGELIAFTRTKNGESNIWLIPLSGGESRKLTNLEEGMFGSIAWSPDGENITFEYRLTHQDWTKKAIEEREKKGLTNPARVITKLHYRRDGEGFRDHPQQVWICDATSGEVKQITDGDWENRDPTWSPDSQWVSFISNRSDDPDGTPHKEDIWKAHKDGGTPIKIKTPNGYKWGLAWSPDGEYIAYIGCETEDDAWSVHNDRMWIVPTDGNPAVCLSQGVDRIAEDVTLSDVRESGNQNPVWVKGGEEILFLISDRGNCHLYSSDLNGKTYAVVDGCLDISGFSALTFGNKIIFLAARPTHPAEIYTAEIDPVSKAVEITSLTTKNTPLISSINLSTPDEVLIQSTEDIDVQGWLLKPPNFDPEKTYPLVLYIHGGPDAQYGNTFFHEFQVLAAHGNVVLYTNPRGSLGREETFAKSIVGNWGDRDFKDLMAAVDHATTLPYIDSDRMAVVGGSYGGFMTNWIIGNTQRFRCAISERSISNRHSAVGSNDFPPNPDGYWEGNPWDRPEKLWHQSPLRFADNMKTPLLIIHSEGDLRCPISQAEQLFSALKKLKREVVFLRYPKETTHGFSRNGPPDLRVDRLHHITRWLNKYLKINGIET